MPGFSGDARLTPAAQRHWTSGDRRGALRVMLPADPRDCLVATDPGSAEVLADMLGATRVDLHGWPLPATADLVVVDERSHDVEAARRALRSDGVLAVIGTRGSWLIYPDTDAPELIWRRGWPAHPDDAASRWARRRAGLAVRRRVPRLSLDGPARPTLADRVLDDLAVATGMSGRLVGVVAAGQTVLRVRQDEGPDIAVRLAMRAVDRPVDVTDRIAEEVPGLAPWLPTVVGRGVTAGHPWVATEWVGPSRPIVGARRRAAAVQLATAAVTDALSAHHTGVTSPGWSQRWGATVDQLPAEHRQAWSALMEPADAGVAMAWCHGDLWRGNVASDGRRAVVLDWDNASPDAPAGLDRLLATALSAEAEAEHGWIHAVLRHVDEPSLLGEAQVGGRAWNDWDRRQRLALAVAAVVLSLRNRAVHAGAGGLVEEAVRAVALVARPPAVDRGTDEGDGPGADGAANGSGDTSQSAGRTARGALWLAANGVAVKGAQTVVLLILAAVLAPEALGLVALGTLVANVSVVMSSLGTASALVFWRGPIERAARTAVTLAAAGGLVVTAVIWAAAPLLSDALDAGNQGTSVIRGLTVTLPLVAVSAVTNELLRRRLAFLRRIIPDATSAVIGAGVAIGLALDGRGVMALVVGQIVQGVLTLLLSWCVHPVVRPGWSSQDARELLSYGGPLAGANLLQLVQLNLDYVVVSVVLGAAALGQYSLAFRLAFMPYLMIAVVVGGAAFPYLCQLTGHRLVEAAVVVMSVTLALITPVCVGLAVFADHLVLLGHKWSEGVPVVALLAGYAWVLAIGTLVQTVLNAVGKTTVAMTLRLVHLVLLILGLALVTRFGIVSVAAGQVTVAALSAVLALRVLRRSVPGFSVRALGVALRPAALAALVMASVLLVLRLLLHLGSVQPSAVTLVSGAALGLLTYAGAVLALDRTRVVGLLGLLRGVR